MKGVKNEKMATNLLGICYINFCVEFLELQPRVHLKRS